MTVVSPWARAEYDVDIYLTGPKGLGPNDIAPGLGWGFALGPRKQAPARPWAGLAYKVRAYIATATAWSALGTEKATGER